MKKAIFAVLVVLLAMLTVTCDSVLLPEKSASGPDQGTPGGSIDPGFVTISIGLSADSRARAMNLTLADTAIDFYEVVFYRKAGGDYLVDVTVRDNIQKSVFQTPGYFWNVIIPRAVYTDDNSGDNVAVLFAGRAGSPNILLAIGVLSAGGADLTANTPPDLTFELSPIESDITASFAGTVPGNPFPVPVVPGSATTEITGVIEMGDPVINIPYGAPSLAATYAFNIPETSVMLGGAATVNSEPIPAGGGFAFSTSSPIVISPGLIDTAINDAAATFSFTFTIPSIATPGYNKIYISVPVYAYNKEVHPNYGKRPHIQWYIQGGLDNAKIEKGTNDGGAVLLELVLDAGYTFAPVQVSP